MEVQRPQERAHRYVAKSDETNPQSGNSRCGASARGVRAARLETFQATLPRTEQTGGGAFLF